MNNDETEVPAFGLSTGDGPTFDWIDEMLEVLRALPGHALRQRPQTAVMECLYCGNSHIYGEDEQHYDGCLYVKARVILSLFDGGA